MIAIYEFSDSLAVFTGYLISSQNGRETEESEENLKTSACLAKVLVSAFKSYLRIGL